DPFASLQVVSPFPGWPADGAGLKQGLWVKQTTTSGKTPSTILTAVVGAAGDLFKIEVVNPLTMGDYIKGLTVKKAGNVTKAIAGKKGEKGKEIKVVETAVKLP